MTRSPARLHLILARKAPVGLVIRRGPSKCVATLLWDRKNDTFQLGQWLKGRIYERRSDLSPDGKHFIYFAMNGQWKSTSKGSWTAISRAPYLKALAMFPKGDCWHGGGLWTKNGEYWLNDGHVPSILPATTEVRRDHKWNPVTNFGGECPGVYYPRLLRDGWTLKDTAEIGVGNQKTMFEKSCPCDWILRKIAHAQVASGPGKGCYWEEHELIHLPAAIVISHPEWEWADLDGKRLVWATKGCLKTGWLTAEGLVDERMLFDFNAMKFSPIQAPY